MKCKKGGQVDKGWKGSKIEAESSLRVLARGTMA